MRKLPALLLLFVLAAEPAQAFFLWPWQGAKKAKASAPAAEAPLALEEAYRMALKRSEDVGLAAEDIELARARFYRSLRYFLPTVGYQITRTERDVERNPGPVSGGESGISSDSRRRVTPESKFTLSQPLFSGFREIAALKASGADRNQQRLEWVRARETLFTDVADAFYAVLQAERDVEILENVRKALDERLDELNDRVELGRSRESEMKTALSDLKIIEADLVGAKLSAASARNLLEFYVGRPLASRELEDGAVPSEPLSEPAYSEAAAKRSDVRAAEEGLRLAENGITSAQAGFFPTVSLDGNYYTKRVGFQDGNDWDFTLKLAVPIFDAGETLGDVKESWSLRDSAKLTLSRTRRAAELEIRDSWLELLSAKAEADAYAYAASAQKESYEIQTADYRNNLVSNLDVLDSLRRYQEVLRENNVSSFDWKRAYWKFRVAIGEVPFDPTTASTEVVG